MTANQTAELVKGLNDFKKETLKQQYHKTDSLIKSSAQAIQRQLPKQASSQTLDSFRKYRYSNNGVSRKLKYKISTKKYSQGNYRFSANLGDDQNLAHLFQDGFDLKQRYGFTHIKPIMDISFEAESEKVARGVVQYMNAQKGD